MVSRDFQALASRRAQRARSLAGPYPASREALEFFAEVVSLQSDLSPSSLAEETDRDSFPDSLLPGRRPLVELVEAKGPPRLRDEAQHYSAAACRDSLHAYLNRKDTVSPRSFFARVLLQPAMYSRSVSGPNSVAPYSADRSSAACPRCAHAPQTGCLRPQGDGTALTLVCSLCLEEWPLPRLRCPSCGENDHRKLSFYSTAEFAHIEVQVCESCRAYLHLVHLEKERQAVPDVDELAALPLDVWAQEKGYRKIQPNLAGI